MSFLTGKLIKSCRESRALEGSRGSMRNDRIRKILRKSQITITPKIK